MKKYFEKFNFISVLYFFLGYLTTGLIPYLELFLSKIIINLYLPVYWLSFLLSLYILFIFSKFLQKKGKFFRINQDKEIFSIKAFRLFLLGAFSGIIISILNIYFIGIFQLVFSKLFLGVINA